MLCIVPILFKNRVQLDCIIASYNALWNMKRLPTAGETMGKKLHLKSAKKKNKFWIHNNMGHCENTNGIDYMMYFL